MSSFNQTCQDNYTILCVLYTSCFKYFFHACVPTKHKNTTDNIFCDGEDDDEYIESRDAERIC